MPLFTLLILRSVALSLIFDAHINIAAIRNFFLLVARCYVTSKVFEIGPCKRSRSANCQVALALFCNAVIAINIAIRLLMEKKGLERERERERERESECNLSFPKRYPKMLKENRPGLL